MKSFFCLIFILTTLLTGCGDDKPVQDTAPKNQIDLSNAKDGTYNVESSRDDKLGYSKLTMSIENHKIVNIDFIGVDLFNNVKDENYGSLISGKDSADYKKAQIAVKASADYARQLIETQALDEVDAISGATISYNQFVETVKNAVNQSK